MGPPQSFSARRASTPLARRATPSPSPVHSRGIWPDGPRERPTSRTPRSISRLSSTRTSDRSSYSCYRRDEERSPLAAIARKLRSELEYIRLVRPTAFARAAVLDARDAVLRRRDPLTPPRRLGFVGSGDFRTAGDAFR